MSGKEKPFFVQQPGLPRAPDQQPADPKGESVSPQAEPAATKPRYKGWQPSRELGGWDVT